jgi:5'-deoxynucleotidase YfbR-like HD superfamily hydrolase
MPFRQEKSAPNFDPTQPRSLLRYFEDLEQLFERCSIQDFAEKKRWTLRYVPIEVADLWEYLPGWISAVDWPSLKRAVAARYPACDDEHRYRFADLVALADSQTSQEISSIEQWSTFLNQFLVISQYLLTRHHLDPLEQQRYLLRSLSPSLRHRVESYRYHVDP